MLPSALKTTISRIERGITNLLGYDRPRHLKRTLVNLRRCSRPTLETGVREVHSVALAYRRDFLLLVIVLGKDP